VGWEEFILLLRLLEAGMVVGFERGGAAENLLHIHNAATVSREGQEKKNEVRETVSRPGWKNTEDPTKR